MILVAGATGFLGGEICRRLRASRRPVRGLMRPTSNIDAVARLRESGVELAEGDLRDGDSLARACRGVDVVVSTVSATRTRQAGDGIEATDEQGQLALVAAARTAGVRRFVYVSFSGQLGGSDPLTVAKRRVERAVQDSGMESVILRPTLFMEVWLSPALGFDYASGRITVYGTGDADISWISRGDVAEFATRAAMDEIPAGTILELGGPEALSPRAVVRVFEDASGRRFDVQSVPEEALRAKEASATDSMERTFAALMLGYAKGDAIAMQKTLAQYPVSLTSVRDYAERALRS